VWRMRYRERGVGPDDVADDLPRMMGEVSIEQPVPQVPDQPIVVPAASTSQVEPATAVVDLPAAAVSSISSDVEPRPVVPTPTPNVRLIPATPLNSQDTAADPVQLQPTPPDVVAAAAAPAPVAARMGPPPPVTTSADAAAAPDCVPPAASASAAPDSASAAPDPVPPAASIDERVVTPADQAAAPSSLPAPAPARRRGRPRTPVPVPPANDDTLGVPRVVTRSQSRSRSPSPMIGGKRKGEEDAAAGPSQSKKPRV
jgi:hypothetical protein